MEFKTPASTPTTSAATTTHGSIDSLSHCSSPRTMEALSDQDHCSLGSDPDLSRVKLMCSYGGRIMPRPHDSQLRYVGGETRLLAVSRHISFSDLMNKLTSLCGRNILLKFQLPNEELDSLVSVLSDEDLENMMEEYDRIESRSGSPKLRLFLFPAKSQSASMVNHDYDSRNAAQRFVDAVNGLTRRQNSMPVTSSSEGLPDFLFGLDVSNHKQDRSFSAALKKVNSTEALPCSRSSHDGAGDVSSDHQWPELLNSSQVNFQQPSLLVDIPSIPTPNPTYVSVADHSPENLEIIKQLASLISAPPDHQEQSVAVLQNSLRKNDEVDRSPSLDDPHEPGKLEEKQQVPIKDHNMLPVSTIRTESKVRPAELLVNAEAVAIQLREEQDQRTSWQHSEGGSGTGQLPVPQLSRAASAFSHGQISPGASSQFPPAIENLVRGGGSVPASQRGYDPCRTAYRQSSFTSPQLAANLQRQMTSVATAAHTEHQQPLPLPSIKVPQPVDQIISPRAPRVQSPSRFRDVPPPTPFQVHWTNNSEERKTLRPPLQQQHRASERTRGVTIQLPTPHEYDYYVDSNGLNFSDPQHVHYADIANSPYELANAQRMICSFKDADITQLHSDKALDSINPHPGAAPNGTQLAGSAAQVRSPESQKHLGSQQPRSTEGQTHGGLPLQARSPEGQIQAVGSPEGPRYVNFYHVIDPILGGHI